MLTDSTTRVVGIAPQFLVDDLETAITYYCNKLGFDLDFCYESFYASVSRDGYANHLKCAAKTASDRANRKDNEHLDAFIAVTGIKQLHEELQSHGARITRGLEERPWSAEDFYVEDPDGYILCFSESVPL